MRVFLAGASGVIGRRMCVLMRDAGMDVIGTTRSAAKASALEALGISPVVIDMFDARAVRDALAAAKPEIVVYQLTDLPRTLAAEDRAAALMRNARIRAEVTPHLMQAAKAAGATRAVAQSVCFAYADGPRPYDESTPLDPSEAQKVTVEGVKALEHAVTTTPGMNGIVLRYGRLYGPDTWTDTPKGAAPLHVDAAAHAAFVAITRGPPGIYNVAEDDGTVSSEKAKRAFGFDAGFRMPPESGG